MFAFFTLFCFALMVSSELDGEHCKQDSSLENFMRLKRNMSLAWNLVKLKLRTRFSTNIIGDQPLSSFPCKTFPPSQPPPTSVHRLRPGDVQVIGALGDSLTAGNGGLAKHYEELLVEFRGIAFPIGGDLDRFTIPNFLRNYNPKLNGFARGFGINSFGDDPRLDMAVPGDRSTGLMNQAKKLVDAMRKDPTINFQEDWKLISVFIGSNDLCFACENTTRYSAKNYLSRLITVLDFLKENVPRAFVNLLPPLNVFLVTQLNHTMFCRLVHLYECPCAFVNNSEIRAITQNYHRALEMLVSSGRYDTSDNFTVVLQPFLERPKLPPLDFFSLDCFHFHSKGHASAAMNYWNNLFSPVGQKSREWDPYEFLKCPSPERPYLFTTKNSNQ